MKSGLISLVVSLIVLLLLNFGDLSGDSGTALWLIIFLVYLFVGLPLLLISFVQLISANRRGSNLGVFLFAVLGNLAVAFKIGMFDKFLGL